MKRTELMRVDVRFKKMCSEMKGEMSYTDFTSSLTNRIKKLKK